MLVCGMRFWVACSLVLFGSIQATLFELPRAVGSDCEPEVGNSRKALAELAGPIERDFPVLTEDEKDAELKRIAQERLKIERERLEQDIRRITNRLQTNLDNLNLWNTRAHLYEKLGRREAAIGDYTEILKRDPKATDALLERGRLWLALNEFEKAEEDADLLISLEPDNEEAHYARGKVFMEQWDTETAKSCFNKVLQLNPDHVLARYNRAYLLVDGSPSSTQLETAANDLKKVLTLDPDLLAAHYQAARVLHAMWRNEEAAREATYILSHNPDTECMYYLRCRIYMNMGKYRAALKDINRFISYSPNIAARHGVRAQIYSRMGKYEKSLDDWKIYLEEYPNDVDAIQGRAEALRSTERYDESIAAWTALMKLSPRLKSNWLEERAKTKAAAGDIEGALADINPAIDTRSYPQYFRARSEFYEMIGEYVKANAEMIQSQKASNNHISNGDPETRYEQQRIRLVKHVDKQIGLIQAEDPLANSQFGSNIYDDHEDWGLLWTIGLSKLLANPEKASIENQLKYVTMFIEAVDLYPLPEKESNKLVAALTKIAESDEPEQLRNKARLEARVLAALVEANDPNQSMSTPGALFFDRFDFAVDESGNTQSLRRGRTPYQWIYFQNDRNKGKAYREIKRTRDYIELLSLRDGEWIRLEEDQVLKSSDRKNWTVLAQGKIAPKEEEKKSK
ncbi:tetratricopeptide repeat protein [Bremerella cremea]|uniref:Uncharacterized protein n=1 Tax=Blastopirellula marina TaxID=124 RepID=A0A2S8FF25_9BACT|nr:MULTISPECIES: tetratricopeptide repeat protein [Pirellulaceae]PQO30524.1 hypothetical protein C5Y83_24515 [Blastopirellula marina]RCS43877.1 tetratricopeptide repeat protein [Bremerella cremea]